MIFLLDMDDTLLDFQTLERETILKTLKQHGVAADTAVAKRFHEINDGLWKSLERGEIKREEIVTKRFDILFQELGENCENVYAVAQDYFSSLQESCYPFEGMLEFLHTLKTWGNVYIVTNGAEVVQRRHLQDGGILPFVSDVFISDCVGYSKPSFEYVNYVKEHIPDFEEHTAVYLGDSLTSDAPCAQRLGAEFILFCPRGVPKNYVGRCARSYREAEEQIVQLNEKNAL